MTSAFAQLLRQLEAEGEVIVRTEGAWLPHEEASVLEAAGILAPTTVRDVVCPGCDYGCVVVPKLTSRADGTATHLHACVERDDIGFVRIDPTRMRAWRFGGHGLAAYLRRQLALSGAHEERIPGWLWQLGEWRRGARRTLYLGLGLASVDRDARLAAAHRAIDGIGPVLLVPGAAPTCDLPFPVLELARLLDDGVGPALDVELVAHRLARPQAQAATVEPFPLPPGATWRTLVLEVVEGERLVIRYGPTTETRTFIEAGMGKRGGKPTRAWDALCLFAKERGVITWRDDKAASADLRDRVRELKEALLALFPGMEGEPFGRYTTERGYEAAFVVRARSA